MFKKLVQILTPFAEATDLTQGELMVTISCVVLILLSLNNLLESYMQNTSVYTSFLHTLLASLRGRFSALYSSITIKFSIQKTPLSKAVLELVREFESLRVKSLALKVKSLLTTLLYACCVLTLVSLNML